MGAMKTYRYVRVAMLLFVVGLGTVLALQIGRQDGCYLGSISAYFYTPAGRFFSAALVAVGALLVCLRSEFDPEDVLLNFAGMFAPVVALVPTTRGVACVGTPAKAEHTGGHVLSEADPRAKAAADLTQRLASQEISLSVWALIAMGAGGLLVLLAVTWFDRASGTGLGAWWNELTWWPIIGFGAAAVVLVVVGWLGLHPSLVQPKTLHTAAAVLMFVCLAGVAAMNAWLVRRQPPITRAHRVARATYGPIAIGMVLTILVAAYLFLTDTRLHHWVFWVEFTEITLFAALWGVQTAELWGQDTRPAPGVTPTLPDLTKAVVSVK
jgi:hypothetical protein